MTTYSVLDRLAAARPDNLTTDERDAILASVVSSTPGLDGAPPTPATWREQQRAQRRRVALGGLAAAVMVAVAAGVPLALSSGTHGSGPEVKLASYSFRLPSGYHRAQDAVVTCGAANIVSWPAGSFASTGQLRNQVNGQPLEPGVVSAANAAGGCVSLALVGPFTPGGPLTPTVAGIGGPVAPAGTPAPQAVQIDSYSALLGSTPVEVLTSPAQTAISGQGTPSNELVLDVTIPVANGQVDDLLLSSTELTAPALEAIASQGLDS